MVELVTGILSGLAHLHSRRLVHRDLKPGNVLLEGLCPEIADFGLARLWPCNEQTFSISGTPPYMAPEAWEGVRSVATDLWSVGVLLYEMLNGHRPFAGTEVVALRKAIQNAPLLPMSTPFPEYVVEVIKKALQKDPGHRFASATAMRAALLNEAEETARETK